MSHVHPNRCEVTMFTPQPFDPCQIALARGADELFLSVTSIRHVLRWAAQLPEGVRNELLRRDVVALKGTDGKVLGS